MTGIDFSAVQNLNGTEVKRMLDLLEPRSLKYSPHTPTPKQQVFMNLTAREAFFGGAAGGGKSDALLMDALQYSDIRGYAAIIFRKSFADLVKPGALIDRAKEWLLPYDNVVWREKDRRFEFIEKYGRKSDIVSILQFGYLENDSDKYNYQGGEYAYAGFDELTHISESNYRYIFSRLRRIKGVDIPIKVRGASNPPDDSQGIWVYNRFVNPETKLKECIFVPAGLDDNPYLDKEEYEEMLNALDPVTRARLRDGNWTVVRKGNMFKREWFQGIPAAELPPHRRRIRFWDMAATTADDSKSRRRGGPDYTVGFLMSEANGIFYIEDIARVQMRPADTEALQLSTAVSDGYGTIIREEQEPGSSGIATIDQKARTIMKGRNYQGIKSSGSKPLRAQGLSAAAERGQVKYVLGCRNIESFFDESESFPGGIHDDIVDGASGAYQELGTMPTTFGVYDIQPQNGGSYWSGMDGNTAGLSVGFWRGFR